MHEIVYANAEQTIVHRAAEQPWILVSEGVLKQVAKDTEGQHLLDTS